MNKKLSVLILTGMLLISMLECKTEKCKPFRRWG